RGWGKASSGWTLPASAQSGDVTITLGLGIRLCYLRTQVSVTTSGACKRHNKR
ncbi:uncharacterized protein PgNI_00158, partial [Pyricularia grisea]|uniref:Uncharacterized protein n=1 Tax=Pyricularia grisea TaxID=148305 RepID=A0A6P8BFN3_PYRGI